MNPKNRALARIGILLAALCIGVAACRLVVPPGASPSSRTAYTVALYAWILCATRACWRRFGPFGGPDLACAPGWTRRLWFGCVVGISVAFAHLAMLLAGGWWHPTAVSASVWLGILVKAAPIAVGEEFLFRGYFFGTLQEGLGRIPAYFLTGAIFALVHLFRPGPLADRLALGVGLFLASCLLCRLVDLTGSLWPAVGLHATLIAATALEPPASISPGLWSGLGGNPPAGIVAWGTFLAALALLSAIGPRVRPVLKRDLHSTWRTQDLTL